MTSQKYIYISEIPEDYQCHHCHGALVDFKKIMCKCSKIFVCYICLDNYSSCSECSSKFIITEADEDFVDKVKKNVGNLLIQCPYYCESYKSGSIMKSIIQISELDAHLKLCNNYPRPCKNRDIGCDVSLPYHNLISHENRCVFTPLRNKIMKDQAEIMDLKEQINKLLDYHEGIISCHCHRGEGWNWTRFSANDDYTYYYFHVGLDDPRYFAKTECYVMGIDIIPDKNGSLFEYFSIKNQISQCHSYKISCLMDMIGKILIIIRTNKDAIFEIRWVAKQ